MSLEEIIEENILLINKYDIFESRFGVFKILDYDLNLDERKLKFKKYDYVLCEVCSQEIEKFSFVCYNCYNKETDCNERNRMNHGICKSCFTSSTSYGCSICNIFKTSDYDLNLKERKVKYRNSNYVLCKDCYKEVDYYRFYCTYCYYKETDVNKKFRMKFGLNYGVFRTSDYKLDLTERRAKYKNSKHILCIECNNKINEYYYCTYCYDKEIDTNKKLHMKFGSNFGIFKTSDYNLNLKQRGAKYGKFHGILCEECNNEINRQYIYCTYCYDKETDTNKKGQMTLGLKIFKTLDYNLDLEERRAKYEKFYGILCEECNKAIKQYDYYCTYCYDKEPDTNKKGHMKFGSNFSIFKTSDYNLNLEERRAKYGKFDGILCGILCEECNKEIKLRHYCTYCYNRETDTNKKGQMTFGPNFGILDYNLNLEERRAKYMNLDGILCKKCNQEISKHFNYYCTNCHDKETDVIKKSHIKFGLNFGIFETFDYNLNLEERKVKYKKYDHIVCEKCNNEIKKQYYNCNYCYRNNQMIINRCKVCFIGNNDDCCSFYEFKQFLENFSKWINENNVFIESKIGISDYDLDEDDRRVKYKNFDYILCEKCDRKYHYNYCYECFDKEMRELSSKLQDYENFYFKVYKKETKELRELKELQSILIDYKNVYFKLNSNLGIFKQIIQQFENAKNYVDNKKILINNIRYNGVHNCWRKLRSYCCDCYDREIDFIEKKRMEFGKLDQNQQEFVSSRYTKRIRTGQVNTDHSNECFDCIIMDID
ncbi:unnamed protein product [Rhizophagus irregularis]|nr:unnamed protein product [Rhizophagus irregularis]